MALYQSLARPLLFSLPPERAHQVALAFLARQSVVRTLRAVCGPCIAGPQQLFGLYFRNPLGLAAGLDKDAAALPAWEALGFGFVEIGTVTREPQPGNAAPRLFRLFEERALINRLGFPSSGAAVVARRLAALKKRGRWPAIPVGINLGKNRDTPVDAAAADYVAGLAALRPFADFFVVNVSSPNTPGLRALQQRSHLRVLLSALQAENSRGPRRPLLLKISPDSSETEIAQILDCLSEARLDGIVATNTTLDKRAVNRKYEGGLSGAPLRQRSTEVIRFIARQTGGRLPIIGVGGVFTADDVREKLEAGASLVQLYTGFIYGGPFTTRDILRGLQDPPTRALPSPPGGPVPRGSHTPEPRA